MDYIGPYLLDSLRATEGAIEIWNAQDAVTGVPALVYKPVIAELPRWRLEGVLTWSSRVADAWVAELPFGARPLSEREEKATAGELTAWARRLLATLLEMRALELSHGRISPEHLWVKGEEVWLEGLGLPVPAREPDEAALVATLKEAAGDSWRGWPFHRVLERLADGELNLREAAERLAEPMSLDELEPAPAEPAEPAPPLEPPSTGTVRVVGRGSARPRPQAGEPEEAAGKPETGPEPPPAVEEPASEAGDAEPLLPEPPRPYRLDPEPAAGRAAKSSEEATPAPPAAEPGGLASEEAGPAPTRATGERPVVRIDEVSEPAFEVIEPERRSGGRQPLRLLLAGLTVVLLAALGFLWHGRQSGPVSGGSGGYAVEFRLEPSGEHAELVLLEAPEGSKLVVDRVLAVIPGKVYFDVPGVYRIQLRASGFLPQEKLLTIPPGSRVITVRLNR